MVSRSSFFVLIQSRELNNGPLYLRRHPARTGCWREISLFFLVELFHYVELHVWLMVKQSDWKVTATFKLWVWIGDHSCEEVSVIFQAGTLSAALYWSTWEFIFLTKETILKTCRFLWECSYQSIFLFHFPSPRWTRNAYLAIQCAISFKNRC